MDRAAMNAAMARIEAPFMTLKQGPHRRGNNHLSAFYAN